MKKIPGLEKLASEMVGDGKSPNLFFVTEKGVVTMITRNFNDAYENWDLNASLGRESALEDRKNGVTCSMEPEEENGRLVRRDHSHMIKNRKYFSPGKQNRV